MPDSIASSIILNGDPFLLDADTPLTALLERLNMRRGRVDKNGLIKPGHD